MKAATQHGFTFPEVVAATALTGLAIGLAASFAGARIDTVEIHAGRAEARDLASWAARAHRGGLLTGATATAADLQHALPQLPIPARLGDGRIYRVALDGDDPRVLIDGNPEAVRPPFPASELRIPLWRAQRLRQIRQASP